MRAVSFIAVVGKAGSKVRGVLTLKGKKVAEGTRTGGPGPVLVKLTLNAKARKALKKKKLAKFALTRDRHAARRRGDHEEGVVLAQARKGPLPGDAQVVDRPGARRVLSRCRRRAGVRAGACRSAPRPTTGRR